MIYNIWFFFNETKFEYQTSFIFNVVDTIGPKNQIDKLEKINLYVAADNTWQGVTYGSWANTKNPLKVIGEIQDFSFNINFVPIEATEWTYVNDTGNFSQCLEDQEPIYKSCKSIFHPKSFIFEKRLVLQDSYSSPTPYFGLFLSMIYPE